MNIFQHLSLAAALVASPELADAAQPLGNLSPEAALHAFELEPEFMISLVAAEPLVVDPVALAFDEKGHLYVAENRDYPTGAPDGKPLGIIARLEDTDGDGRMDRRTEFAAGLAYPNGVMCWRGGVLVTAAPHVWWLADSDGDGRADVKELVLTGFDTNSTSQLRANDPTLGPDGWVHIAGGLRGGKVSSPKRPGIIADTDKGDLRFHPDTGELELVAGKSQFGLAFDDAANRFACMNRIQSQHAPLPGRYLARNPFVTPPGALHDCPRIFENTLMTRYRAGADRYFPISDNLTTADSHLGTYSAACAVHIYRGNNLPVDYHGAAFSCDPTGNLVRADRLKKIGGTFAALRIHEGTEALRSRDNWFRPVFLADGPEGSLYIADMYRRTIEHPDYLPGEVRKHTDFEGGKGMGRIWRLKSRKLSRISTLGFGSVDIHNLIEALASPFPWRRDTAFRLMLERNDPQMAAPLRMAFNTAKAPGSAVLQLRLLHLLHGLDRQTLLRALRHAQPAVRQNAVQFSETTLGTDEKLFENVIALATDPDSHVRFQVALSLGETRGRNLARPLFEIAKQQANDHWTRAAIMTCLGNQRLALALLEAAAGYSISKPVDEGLLALVADIARQLCASASPDNRIHVYQEIWQAIQTGEPMIAIAASMGFAQAATDTYQGIAADQSASFKNLLAQARAVVTRLESSPERRARALELLAYDPSPETGRLLSEFLDPAQPQELQLAAAHGLSHPWQASSLSPLLAESRWSALTPAIRSTLLNRLAGRPELARLLIEAIEGGSIPAGILTPFQRDQLKKTKDEALRVRAEKLFAVISAGGSREQAFEEAKLSLKLAPKPDNGRSVFEKSCASCHRLNQIGVAVGPDLFDIRQQSKESILFHIIAPEAEIAPSFVNYECELKSGATLTGLLAAETSAQITLRMTQGIEETVPRDQISKLTASRLSLMPQDLEKTITRQEMADLLAYLRGEQ